VSFVHVAVEEILDRFLGHFKLLGFGVSLVQGAPVLRGDSRYAR